MNKCDGGQKRHKGFFSSFKAYLRQHRLGDLLVSTGKITAQDLKSALAQQKESYAPLGQIFIENNLITRRQLTGVLVRQHVLRTVAAGTFFIATLTFQGKKAQADIRDVPARISISQNISSFNHASMAAYPGLFGTDEKRSENISPFTKWTSMFDRFERDLNNPASKRILAGWKNQLKRFSGMDLKAMADKVNTLVNKTRYIPDSKLWGQSDHWATPAEFLSRGGDCEDFAITKYTALRALGVPEERLRIAIVQDTVKNIPHAVLVVYTDEGSYILDNQIKRLVSAESGDRYRPIFSINRTAWWLHQAPEPQTTVLAAAY